MDDRPPPEEEALLMSILALGVYSLGRGEVSEGKTRETTAKAVTPIAAIRVTARIIALCRQSTANRSMREISSPPGVWADGVSGDVGVIVLMGSPHSV
jgi:hypothetical protein